MRPTVLLDATDPWIRWSWVTGHTDRILGDLGQHLELTLIAIAVGMVLAVPIGVLAWRFRRSRGPVLAIGGAVYTIPSLALFALLVPSTGGPGLAIVFDVGLAFGQRLLTPWMHA